MRLKFPKAMRWRRRPGLILVDIARSPETLKASRIGPMMAAFYNHLARMIYAEARSWKLDLRRSSAGDVDSRRPTLGLKGDDGDYSLSNLTV
ncbi:hypothetical protein ACRAWD_16640 [Caulobacter segnis]